MIGILITTTTTTMIGIFLSFTAITVLSTVFTGVEKTKPLVSLKKKKKKKEKRKEKKNGIRCEITFSQHLL